MLLLAHLLAAVLLGHMEHVFQMSTPLNNFIPHLKLMLAAQGHSHATYKRTTVVIVITTAHKQNAKTVLQVFLVH